LIYVIISIVAKEAYFYFRQLFSMFKSSEETTNELSVVYKNTSRIVIIQILATVLLVGLAWILVPRVDLSISEQTILLLWGLMICFVVGIVLSQRFFLSPSRLKKLTDSVGFEGFLLEMKIKTTMLGVFCVLVAVFGFLISVMSSNSVEMFRTAAIVFVVFLVIFPRQQIWQKLATFVLNTQR
jgi:hypothetical protein